MSGTYTAPGVYIQELPAPVHTIIGVPTAITAFIGTAARGPMNEPISIGSYAEYESNFGGDGTLPLDISVSLFFQNGGGDAIIVRVGANALPSASAKLPDKFANLDLSKQPALLAASPGAWGNKLTGTVDQTDLSPKEAGSLFNLTISNGAAVERYIRVATDAGSPRSLARLLAGSSLVKLAPPGTTDKPPEAAAKGATGATGATSAPSTEAASGPKETTEAPKPGEGAAPPQSAQFGFAGADGSDQGAKNPDLLGDPASQTGIYALLKHNTFFNLLVLTPVEGADVVPETLSKAAVFARDHRAMLIADTPSGWAAVTDAANKRDDEFFAKFGTETTNAAVYFPRLSLLSDKGGSVPNVGAAGAVAGLYAATDLSRGVWKAPAGIAVKLSGIDSLQLRMSDHDNGRLNPLAINCLRSLPVVGNVVWGARTMAGDDISASQWKYVPIRRLALFIEESLYRGTQWVVFEPNDEPLWAQVRLNIGSFMHGLFRQGAFQGTTAADAYFVKCDKDTNPQADIDNGILNVIVGFAPLKPAEFVVLKIQQISPQGDI